jgi:hypothetical protein
MCHDFDFVFFYHFNLINKNWAFIKSFVSHTKFLPLLFFEKKNHGIATRWKRKGSKPEKTAVKIDCVG